MAPTSATIEDEVGVITLFLIRWDVYALSLSQHRSGA